LTWARSAMRGWPSIVRVVAILYNYGRAVQ
jgi:hypothetical protein